MIKLRIKNFSLRPKFDVGDILELAGCILSSRKFLKLNLTPESLPTVWELTGNPWYFLAFILTVTGLTKCDFQTTSLIFITKWKPPEYRSYQCTYRHCGIFSRSSWNQRSLRRSILTQHPTQPNFRKFIQISWETFGRACLSRTS